MDKKDDGIIIEVKTLNPKRGEKSLDETVKAALKQIEDKKYETDIIARGTPEQKISKYGFAFRGKEVLIG